MKQACFQPAPSLPNFLCPPPTQTQTDRHTDTDRHRHTQTDTHTQTHTHIIAPHIIAPRLPYAAYGPHSRSRAVRSLVLLCAAVQTQPVQKQESDAMYETFNDADQDASGRLQQQLANSQEQDDYVTAVRKNILAGGDCSSSSLAS